MTKLIDGRTPAQQSAWNRAHFIGAALLAVALLLLWLVGKGPGAATAGGGCCQAGDGGDPPATALSATAPSAPPDADGDGIPDDADRCAATPAGDRVGPFGCSCDVTVQLQYEFDSDRLTAEDKRRLDAAAARLRELAFETGEVGGYADSSGDDAYNLELSQRRAEAARDYLVAQGIAAERLSAVGYGEANPIADNATPEGRALNRRAVIRRTDCVRPAGSEATPR